MKGRIDLKRIASFVLCLCLLFSFAGCNKEGREELTAIVDLENCAQQGKIPECEYKLGQSVDEMISDLEKVEETEHSEDDEEYSPHGEEISHTVMEFDDYTSIHLGETEYCYRENNKEKGISCIINYVDSYNFPIGTVTLEIKEALTKFELEEYDSDGLFFMPSTPNLSCLKYKFEKNDIVFVFVDNALCAAVIYKNDEWSL